MWVYETDEDPKRKHHWSKNTAGFTIEYGIKVSKCPANLSLATITALLNNGFEFYRPKRSRDFPTRIYAVLDGVVYRASPTNPGVSYHGFPELRENLPPSREVREALLELARKDGSEETVKKWLK
ncbi:MULTISPECIES: hypothetical protein [unclassified Frigoribacterium]|uniref:hypothetical protein n=1 Tax=unclassified Frigoribacterium TaxID=2627005 RepID=UPI0012FB5DC3|nr:MULTISPECIES: hypothetical protein [unclassified Frigoribacterium]